MTTSIPSAYKLAVDGKIIAEEVKVMDSGSWPDYVFQAAYDLMPLPDVERSSLFPSHRLAGRLQVLIMVVIV